MPKVKTKKTLVKKVRVTRNGKVVRERAFAAHLRSKKTSQARHRGTIQKVADKVSQSWSNIIK